MTTVYSIVVVGDSGVGKTTLCNRLIKQPLIRPEPTIGVDLFVKVLKNGVQLEIWDTGGSSKFDTFNDVYTRHADLMLLVYDSTSASSLARVRMMLHLYRDKPAIVLGTHGKSRDLVCVEEGNQVATAYGAVHLLVDTDFELTPLTSSIMKTIQARNGKPTPEKPVHPALRFSPLSWFRVCFGGNDF